MSDEENNKSRVWGQISGITAVMAGIFVFFQYLPDFAPERPSTFLRQMGTQGSDDLCDISNMGFLRVDANRSPLVMRVFADPAPRAGEPVDMIVSLATPGGRPVRYADLVETHTRKVHLLIIDPSLADYHHVHPVPTAVEGEYRFSFSPRAGGNYRFFADLLPGITGRPVHAVADMAVLGESWAPADAFGLTAEAEGYRFELKAPAELRVGRPALVRLELSHPEGGQVQLAPVMGAFAHLVAFDDERSGFAHMHPIEEGLDIALDSHTPGLDFLFFANQPGRFTIWAQVKIADREIFAPFSVAVR